ncbi:splicing regulatory glutamine/lysine-rich protein 1 isoform X1 [Drosophila eugracilis]|uniref:splicing regulatory glutamine/lysine-rich protein 1 isoform X1 n=1 Tax=Drosophila eugracilis TaxID=29029 RepID=UPI001BDA4DA8|nr:splicing regulatory glutamine/lysine-rich protein 1 isoform X1 [Drosophila eugracilis]
MDRHRRERSPHRERRRERSPYRARRREHSPYREKRRERQQVLTYKQLQKMPLNLRKKAVREARNRNEKIRGNRKKWKKARQDVPTPTRRLQNNFDRSEHNAMLASTSQELRQILQDFETLSDIPHDITPIELRGEIAIAEGQATTIRVRRDGLSTLTVVLHQREPTIAQLKRAIALISRAQHKRNQRERNEERLRRRGIADDSNDRRQRQPVVVASSTGELVHSAQRNGHDHRAFVSWRFLWRCFGLLNVDTNQPIDDRSSSGRATLKELGIKNAATLKFVHRVKYFGRQRQS